MHPYEQPATLPAPEQWDQSAQGKTAWPELDWWKNFKSDELTALMEEAKANNDDLAAAIARVRQANAQASINGAPLLPSIEATGGTTKNIAADKATSTRMHGTSHTAALSASYEIDFWGKNRSTSDAADALRDASAYDQQTVLLTVTSSVANVYFDGLATAERIAIAQKNLESAEKLSDALNRRFDAGLVSKLDVAQQETLVSTQRAALAPLQLKWTQNRNALALLLGRLPESMPEVEETFDAIALPDVPQGVPSQLLQRRPDVASAEANLMAAHGDVNAARAAFFPSISLTGGTNFASATLGNLFKPGSQLLTFGASLTQPLFEGSRLSGQLDYAHAREDELTANYHKSIVNAFADVENALAAIHRATEEEEAQAQAEQSARTAFTLSQQQFEAGIVDITSVLNTQRSLFAASDAHLQSNLKRLQVLVGLYKALGGGWEKASAHPES